MKTQQVLGTVIMLAAAAAFADGANVWQYDTAGAVITNSACDWKIPIASWNTTTGILTLKRNADGHAQGNGDLDLRDLAIQTGDATPVKVTQLNLTSVYGNESPFFKHATLTSFSADNIAYLGRPFDQCSVLTNLNLSYHPNFNGQIPAYGFRSGKLACDISQIVPVNATTIGNYAFNGAPVTGVLRLNNATSIGTSAFQKSKLSGLEIGGALVSIGSNAFYDEKTLKYAAFSGRSAFTVGASAFVNCPFTNITFAGAALASADMDNLLGGVTAIADTATKGKNCTIYASKTLDDGAWRLLAAPLSGNEANYTPDKTFGVFRDGSRKAWLVHRRSIFDRCDSTIFMVQ